MSHLVGIDSSNNARIHIRDLEHRVHFEVSCTALAPDDLTHPPTSLVSSRVEFSGEIGDADGHPWNARRTEVVH